MRLLRTATLAVALVAVGCSADPARKGCRQDSDCGDAAQVRCVVDTGECRCRTDAACGQGELCNAEGYCQVKLGCRESRDCPMGFFCDLAAATCLPSGRCTSDLHCGAGEVCDSRTKLCKAGCRSHGDCALGDVCFCASASDAGAAEVPCGCSAGTEEERQSCAVGRCVSGTCVDDTWCAFGEVCRSPPDGGRKRCVSDYDPGTRPYCDACVWGPAGDDACGNGAANFCLYSSLSTTSYCGVDCSAGQACPNGYTCGDVIVVYMKTRCYSVEDCRTPENRSGVPCTRAEDCPNGALCDVESGFCYGDCIKGEGARESFCACVEDTDCAQNYCDPTTYRCSISKTACDPVLQDCRPIRCRNLPNRTGCYIGDNCKPLEGLTCADLRARSQ